MNTRSIVVLPRLEKLLAQLGENLKLSRLRRKLTTQQVAERAGITRTTLWQVEKGAPHVSMGAYAQVLFVLGMEKDLLMRNSASPNSNLEELWRRIVFFIAVKNTDDHLRNHGFLLTPGGWTLSPAYDINPVYFGTGLTSNISETDNALDWDLARSVQAFEH